MTPPHPRWFDRLPYEWQIGWRYTRAGRAGRSNRFVSFISAVSVLGILLGVAALIIVLSVMNGFQREVRERMLSVMAHVEVTAQDGEALPDWQATAAAVVRHPAVQGVAPFVASQALLASGPTLRGATVRGVDPSREGAVMPLARRQPEVLATLTPGAWRIVLGGELARQLGVRIGDAVTMTAPGGQVTPAGLLPRQRSFMVSAIFEAGHHEHDSGLALVHLDDAARLFRLQGPQGVQLALADVQQARTVSAQLASQLGPAVTVTDWTRTHRSWFDAVQVEKRLMAVILTLIVAVAAFNLVSTLVMTVTDKRADIAILRTLGASPRSVMGIFVVQGAMAGLIGTAGGVLVGLGVALHIDVIVPAIERALGVAFLPGSIYVISRMPSDPMAGDIVPITAVAVALSFLATLYPSWRASRVNPAEALRYE